MRNGIIRITKLEYWFENKNIQMPGLNPKKHKLFLL